MANAEQAIEKLQIIYVVTGADQAQAADRGIARSRDDYTAATGRATTATAQMERQLAAAVRAANDNVRATQQLAVANDNVAKSISASHDSAAKSIAGTAKEVIELGGKLRTLATVAYLTWPAFRNGVNLQALPALKLLHTGLSEVAPVATAAGVTMLRSLAPAFALLSTIALPIMAIIVAWKALNYVIDVGSGLLEKYGKFQRNLIENVDQNLDKLTKFQSDTISLQQVKYATELGDRLSVAYRTINDFLTVQIDVTNYALKLQNVWVRIVEVIAQAVSYINILVDKLSKIPNIGNIATAAASAIPGVGVPVAAYRAMDALSPKLPEPTQAELLTAAYERLAAGMKSTTNFAVRFGQAINDLANPPKIATDETKKLVAEFDRLEASMQRQIAAQEADARTVNAGIQEHARLRAELRLIETAQQDIAKNGGSLSDYAERIRTLADRAGEAALALEKAKVASQIKFNRETALLSSEDVQIASALKGLYPDVATALNSVEAAELRVINMQIAMFDGAKDFAKTFASGILDGRDAIDSLTSALDNLAQKLLNSGIENALTGLLSGNVVQASIGALQVAGAFIIDAFSDQTKAEREQQKKLEEAKKQWSDMQDQVIAFEDKMKGRTLGPLTTALDDAKRQMDLLVKAAAAAGDWPAVRKLQQEYNEGVAKLMATFTRSWGSMVAAMASGNEEFARGQQAVQDLGESLKAFVTDTQTAAGRQSGYWYQVSVEEAQAAAQHKALQALTGGDPLSDVAKSLGYISGAAMQLQVTLQELGLSADEAARRIAEGVTVAIDRLRATFTDDLSRKINELSGQGYLNSFADLFKQTGQMRSDASALGLGTGDIDRFFALSAQKIVDESKLTGAAFDELMIKFPGLTGLVHEFNGAIARTADELTKARLGIADELFAVVNDTSTVAGQIAALDREFARRREEELKAGGQLLPDLESLYQAKRFKIIEDFNDKAIEEEKRAAKERQDALNSAARNIVDYINGLVSGPSSTLSPTAILANAQSVYNANLALAQGGNIDALNKFTSLADNLEKAARAVYASSSGYQNIRNQIISQGLSLPAVTTSTDPVVQAMVNVLNELQNPVGSLKAIAMATGGTETNTSETGAINQSLTGPSGSIISALGANGSINQSLVGSSGSVTAALGANGAINQSLVGSSGSVTAALGADGWINQSLVGSSGSIASALGANGSINQSLTGTSGSIASALGANGAINQSLTGTSGSIASALGANGAINQSLTGTSGSIASHLGANGTINQSLVGPSGSLATALGPNGEIRLALVGPTGSVTASLGPNGEIATNTSETAANIGPNDNEGMRGILTLLKQQYSGMLTISVPNSAQDPDSRETYTLDNSMLLALNKIVWNTFRISENTALGYLSGTRDKGIAGTYALGGWIKGGTPGVDSVPILAMHGEHITNAISARANAPILDAINAARGPIDIRPMQMLPSYSMVANDNYSREIVFELRRLYARIEQLESRLVAAEMRGAQQVAGAVVESAEVIEDGMNNVARETRIAGEKQRAA